MTNETNADATLQVWEEQLESDDATRLHEAEALIERLARRSGHLVHDMNNGLTRMLGRTNLALEAMNRDEAPSETDLQALRKISRELADLSRALMSEVVMPARRHVRERQG